MNLSPLDSIIITFDDLSDDFDLYDGRTSKLAEGQYEIPMNDCRWLNKKTGIIWRWEHSTAFAQQLAMGNHVKLQTYMIDNLKKEKESKT